MTTVSQVFPNPSAVRFEQLLGAVVTGINARRQAILEQYNVSELDIRIITFLHENDEKKMKEVGEFFSIKLSTLTSTIDKLEKNKLVRRKNSKEDRRVIFIQPTNKGQKLLVDLNNVTHALTETLVRETDEAEYATITKALETMRRLI